MTRVFGLVLALAWLSPSPALAGDLTLRDVIELHRSGLGEDLLLAVIEADGGPITLTFADIQDLKSDGFSERLIAALVRTGAHSAGRTSEGAAPVVHVQQEVTNVVIPAVVVVDPGATYRTSRYRGEPGVADPDDFDGRNGYRNGRDAHGARRRPAQPPPAAWVTRQEDGKNVTATGELRRGVPPAAWVTQREPKVERRSDADKPQPKS